MTETAKVQSLNSGPNFTLALTQANEIRQLYWGGSDKVDILFRAVELAEETGELLGAVKKLHRAANGIVGNTATIEALTENLQDELGDVFICLTLLAHKLNLSMDASAALKFNKTSQKHNIPVMLGTDGNNWTITIPASEETFE